MHEPIFHFRSLAKMRIAFFKIAFSSSKSRKRFWRSRAARSSGRHGPLPMKGCVGCSWVALIHPCNVLDGTPNSWAT